MLSHHFQQHTGVIVGFTRLLTRGKFAISPKTSGYTWLELFLCSVALSDSPLSHIQCTTARSQKALVHQIREFATAASTVLKFILKVAPQSMFLASTKLPDRLRSFGYHNRVTHTCAHVSLSQHTQQALHVLMLSLKQPLTKDQVEAHEQDRPQIRTSKFSGHHQIRGTAAMLRLSDCLKGELSVQVASFV